MTNSKVLIVQLATNNIDAYAVYGIGSVLHYAKQHGYAHIVQRQKILDDMHINWTKIELIRRHLEGGRYTHVVLMDADMIIVNKQFSLKYWLNGPAPICMAQDTPLFKPSQPNAGLIIVKQNEPGIQIIAKWLSAARNEGKHLADTHPRNQLVYWNYVMPDFIHHQQLIPRKYVSKYLNSWLVGNIRNRFIIHITQSDPSERAGIMAKLYKQYVGDSELLNKVKNQLLTEDEALVLSGFE